MRNASCFFLVLLLGFNVALFAKESPAKPTELAEPTNPPQPTSSEIEKLRKENAELKAQNKRIIERLKTAHATTDSGNLIPVFVGKQEEVLGTKPTLREQIAKSKVPNIEEATRVAIAHQVKEVGGLGANQAWSVTNLFRLGGEIKSFAKNGDLIWEVRIGRSFGPPQVGVNQVIWVNSTNGIARSLMPVSNKNKLQPEKKKQAKQSNADVRGVANWLDYLKQNQSDLQRGVAEKLSTLLRSKVATHDEARAVVGEFYYEATGDLTLKDIVEVTDLFELGVNVKGFARKGDLVWHARVIKDGAGVVFSGWVSSTTGQLRVISVQKPEKRDVHERSKEAQQERFRPNI